MTTFILVHGAWHGGWCWDEVAPFLKAAGHQVVAPDLPGMGKDKTPLSKVDLSKWTLSISDEVVQAFDSVVLVGHSRGGIVISEVAEIVPDRIKTLVYLAAFLVPTGKTLADMLASVPDNPIAEGAIVMREDGISSVIAPAKVGPVFYNTTSPELTARAASLLSPEPMMSFTTPLRLSDTRYGRVKRGYIECAQDNAIPITLQRKMQQALPCAPVVTLDTDHSPFFSAPEALCRALLAMSEA
ncbi:MAG: alpha/beta fold hydrolase [Alphaproteobacteria bacterium]|nr:alpha/beta fold hydrolase [Alphaproteobacteria bacterium]